VLDWLHFESYPHVLAFDAAVAFVAAAFFMLECGPSALPE
jgi:hypothetical protein